jgi:hypothetical protein
VSDIHCENSRLESISDSRQKPSRSKRTADGEVLVAFPTQGTGSRPTKQPETTEKVADATICPRIVAAASRTVPFLGMNRAEAAAYIGVSPSKFDEMVKDGRMPPSKRIDTRCVWDIRQLTSAFDKLPGGADDDQNEWNEVLQIPLEERQHGSH